MLKLIKFTGNENYIFPSGRPATKESITEKCPAGLMVPHVLELNGNVVQAIQNLSVLRNLHSIDESLTDDEAIAGIEVIINTPPVVEPSPEERIAAAMEYQNLLSL